jgi:adhesin transport system membrane fusion protein
MNMNMRAMMQRFQAWRQGSAVPSGSAALVFDQGDGWRHYDEVADDTRLVRSTRVVTLSAVILGALLTWSYFAEVTEVSTGDGRVIPNSREQVIQSLEGGILRELFVKEGDIVEANQVLAQLDLTKTESSVEESAAKYRATLASVARLQAEVNGTELAFPTELDDYPDLVTTETRLYNTRRDALNESLAGVEQSLQLVREELTLTENLEKVGAASSVEVLRLRRQLSELQVQANDIRSQYMVTAREELATAHAESESLSSVVRGRADSLARLTLRSPVRGIVKDIGITTQGGVIPPNGQLMAIVPLDDTLLVESRISPRDIAFIHPGQEAKVKITAYDYTVYGDMEGTVSLISPDTIQDETRPDVFYYRVFVQTAADTLQDKNGASLAIVPGMIATVDIRTGEKTVFDYLMTPMKKARQALRER